MHRQAFEFQALLDAVATLGRVAAVVQRLPGGAAEGDYASQADRTIGVSAAPGGGVAVLAPGAEIVALGGGPFSLTAARLCAAPLGEATVVVMAVRVQDIAEGAGRTALVVVAPSQRDGRVVVPLVGPNVDQRQGASFPDGAICLFRVRECPHPR